MLHVVADALLVDKTYGISKTEDAGRSELDLLGKSSVDMELGLCPVHADPLSFDVKTKLLGMFSESSSVRPVNVRDPGRTILPANMYVHQGATPYYVYDVLMLDETRKVGKL